MKTVVVKIGGSLAVDENKLAEFLDATAQLAQQDFHLVVVHGGGKDINENLALLQETPEFIQGLRVTTPSILKMVEMTLSGHVNKKLVQMLGQRHCRAVGISGVDAAMIQATQLQGSVDLGRVGDVSTVHPQLLNHLLEGGYLPVVSPISYGDDGAFNVNADTVASEVAVALQADVLVLISDVPGVLDDSKSVIAELNAEKIEHLIQEGVISGGMIPKVRASLDSISRGLRSIHIVGWKNAEALKQQISGEKNNGTIIC